jgi:Tfp pilus assembly protein PilV
MTILNFRRGFTLIEIMVYAAVLVVLVLVIFSFLAWAIKSNAKTKAMRETLGNARRAMEIISYEIKGAESIYTPTSIFDSNPGQLSLKTTRYLPDGEEASYIDFYLCDDRLCLKKESENQIALTSEMVKVSDLVFSRIISGENSSVQIDLKVDYNNSTNKPEYQSSINIESVVSLRSY